MFFWPLSLFSGTKTTPPPSGMRTIPCTAVDRMAASNLVLTTGLVISARLDARRLEETLSTLIERKFPRAGARLALRNGTYEFQIPDTFDATTPPAIFTVEDHPEAYNCAGRPEIPSALTGSEPCVTPFPELDVFFRSKTCPKSEDDFLKPNVPLLHVHIAVFNDLTFIGVTSPHMAFDAMGTATLLGAWARVIGGEDLDTIPGMAWDAQPFAPFVPGPSSNSPIRVRRGWFELWWLSQFSFIVRFILSVIRDPKEVEYFVRVPKVFLDAEKQKIMDELKARGSSEYVGSGDVLMAWWFKTVFSYRALTDRAPFHLHVVNSLRGHPIFAQDAPLAHPYIHNAVSGIPVPPIPIGAFREESVGELALRIRRAIVANNADPANIVADLRWLFARANASKTVFPCPPGAEFSVQTSWRAGKLGELDFSGAVANEDGKPGTAPVVFVYPVVTTNKTVPMRGNGAVLMEDEHVVWMSQIRGAKDWENIRQSGTIVFT
ncbi:hypothetical protein K438DRAFT_1673227 [Mycena galopus ATCC 62051]|nr:hypothetical protein K438DRAFT_1673227 [Mycena galopus ATCC 62051]